MTDPTTHPQGAEETLKETVPKDCLWEEMDKLTNTPIRYVTEAMHTHTEDWLKYFAERVKGEVKGFFYEDGAEIITPIDKVSIDSLLSEVTAKMKEGKP